MNVRRRLIIGCGAVLLACSTATGAYGGDGATGNGPVRIENVEVRLSAAGPVVLLKARHRAIPVFVDEIVAESIQGALTGRKTPRPLTHDLMRTVLEAFDGKVTQVVVTLKDRIYRAALTVSVRQTVRVFDSRSSDAIALAVQFKAPIFVNQDLLDAQGVELEHPPTKPETRT